MIRNWSNRAFDTTNLTLLLLISAITLFPFFHVFTMSFSTFEDQVKGEFLLWPRKWDFSAYEYIFSTRVFFRSLQNTVFITVVGTAVNLAVTSLMAYACSRRDFSGRRWILFAVLFTMLFGGGMVPTYLIVKATGLINSLWSLIIPSAVSAFNLLVMREFFESIHEDITNSAKIDGCNDMGIYFKIILPLSMPAIASFTLFYAVGHWNSYFNAVLYLNGQDKWPIQILLRQVVLIGQDDIYSHLNPDIPLPPSISTQMATVIVSSLPIIVVYPFLQKYFVKGLTLGAVKG